MACSVPQHYCLRWNNHQANLTSVFDQLLQSESFVDVTLAVSGRALKAHKVILSACSPYFQTLLCDNPCQHPIVILKDVSYADMHAVLQFMYKGEISVAEQQLPSLLKVAETLKIRGLADVPEGGRRSCAPSPTAAERTAATPELIESCVDVSCALSPAGSGAASPLVSRAAATAATDTAHDIRPAIAEMIKDEERAKLLENAASWTSPPDVTFQHQLQAAWQKSWNQKQSLMQNVRFRDRGSVKSWRPETMADAILSVLRKGHTLSQAAREYDIPYPTFVLYANRVHNLLGPSVDSPGCSPNELRPKGRGRPQRILLGTWPDETVKNVIRAVVFRDTSGLKEQQMEEANAAAAAAAASRNNESPSHGAPMPVPQQNGRPPYPVSSAALAPRLAMDPGPPRAPHQGPALGGPQGTPLRPPIGHHAPVSRPPPPTVAPPRGQMPNLLGFPDIHMMMGMFPPGMMSSTGAVPTINLPPLVDSKPPVTAASARSPPARPVPPLSSIGASECSPDRSGADTPADAAQHPMDTAEPAQQHQHQHQRPPAPAEEAPARPQQPGQSLAQVQQLAQVQRARLMAQVPPLQPDSPPGGAAVGGEQRPPWQQPAAAERAPLPVTSPAIQATP